MNVIEEVIASRDLRLMKNKVEVLGVPNVFYDPLNFRLVLIKETPHEQVKMADTTIPTTEVEKFLIAPEKKMPKKRKK